MSNRDDVYTASTPFGAVEVEFPEDGGSLFSGAPDAVAYIKDVMARNTNGRGITMTEANLEPVDFVNFCQPTGSGILIAEPFDNLMRYGSMIEGETPA